MYHWYRCYETHQRIKSSILATSAFFWISLWLHIRASDQANEKSWLHQYIRIGGTNTHVLVNENVYQRYPSQYYFCFSFESLAMWCCVECECSLYYLYYYSMYVCVCMCVNDGHMWSGECADKTLSQCTIKTRLGFYTHTFTGFGCFTVPHATFTAGIVIGETLFGFENLNCHQCIYIDRETL